MSARLQQFARECHDILKAEPGPAGRRKIAARLEGLLADRKFLGENLSDATPERQVLYEDPELGFCILAHSYKSAKTSPPHDHGPSWAIYGQAKGETSMTDFALLEAATPEKAGKAKALRTYKLTPGMAHVYNEGELHSPRRDGPTQLIRLEGMNMDRIKRLKFDAV
ncbi:MAG: hypothetical protein ACM30H_13005 [Clostridia bacterium]